MTGSIIDELRARQKSGSRPLMIGEFGTLSFSDIENSTRVDLSAVEPGDVVALIGDFNATSIATLLRLIDKRVIVVPLTTDTRASHPYFHEVAHVNVAIEDGRLTRSPRQGGNSQLLQELRDSGHAGLVLFSSGTTGRPKAILHDLSKFLLRYRTPRDALVTMSFLLFDHIGGINTLFHTLYNNGQVVVPRRRAVAETIGDICRFDVELLPTTPTFLRMALTSGEIDRLAGSSLKVITYGTERMDANTLAQLCERLPRVDFKQTYGMSELGIMRVKSKARDSLFMKVGGEGIKTRVRADAILEILSDNRMLGYLNAPSPFDDQGWYDTKDLVERDGEWIRIVGRNSDVINVGGQKILPVEIERVALGFPGVTLAKARAVPNPITGEHIEVTVEGAADAILERAKLREHFNQHLPPGLRPHKITVGTIAVSHRFKQS